MYMVMGVGSVEPTRWHPLSLKVWLPPTVTKVLEATLSSICGRFRTSPKAPRRQHASDPEGTNGGPKEWGS